MAPVLPYNSVSIDSSCVHFIKTFQQCLTACQGDMPSIVARLQARWTNEENSNPALPCLSVRTGLDLFLAAQAYPVGSEVIMTAINIQDMAVVVRSHGLKVVPLDLHIETLEPKLDQMEALVTPRTVAILVAHLYGCRMNMHPIIQLARKYCVHVIEDCAECFSGFSYLGHPHSDVAMFSFGAIKFSTSFGGGVMKVRDQKIFDCMKRIQSGYVVQSNQAYRKKVVKYLFLYLGLYTWPLPFLYLRLYRHGWDVKDVFVRYVRGFPHGLMGSIRLQPSPALLAVMLMTHTAFDPSTFDSRRAKGEYFQSRLPPDMLPVGQAAGCNSFWLFPVLVKHPDATIRQLNMMGVAAYRGSTQLSVIQPDTDTSADVDVDADTADCTADPSLSLETLAVADPLKVCVSEGTTPTSTTSSCGNSYRPYEAQFLIKHVIYLPVNQHVPYRDLDLMLAVCREAMRIVALPARGQGSADTRAVTVLVKSRL